MPVFLLNCSRFNELLKILRFVCCSSLKHEQSTMLGKQVCMLQA